MSVRVPTYSQPTWRGFVLNNPQIYPGWATPADHPAICAAVESYRQVVTPNIAAVGGEKMSAEPRVDCWIFSTDAVLFQVPKDDETIKISESKQWVTEKVFKHPAMLGIGAGYEQQAHSIGEFCDLRQMVHASAMMAIYPSLLRACKTKP